MSTNNFTSAHRGLIVSSNYATASGEDVVKANNTVYQEDVWGGMAVKLTVFRNLKISASTHQASPGLICQQFQLLK